MLKMGFFTMLPLLTLLMVIATEAATTNCGLRRTKETAMEDRIHGGQTTEPMEYPWMVSLKEYGRWMPEWNNETDTNDTPSLCTGVILNERWVLTSASCIDNTDIGFESEPHSELVFGEYDYYFTDENEELRNISKVVKHPKAGTKDDPSTEFDFALVELNTPLDFNTTELMPICLQENPDFDFTGQEGIFVGFATNYYAWNSTHDNTSKSRKLKVKVLSETGCLAAYDGNSTLVRRETYCAASDNWEEGPCRSDWGAPLFSSLDEQNSYQLVGITSYKFRCGRISKPTIVSRVGSALQWIKDTIK